MALTSFWLSPNHFDMMELARMFKNTAPDSFAKACKIIHSFQPGSGYNIVTDNKYLMHKKLTHVYLLCTTFKAVVLVC